MFRRRKKRPVISPPSNFEHRVHTGIDQRSGVFFGLPAQWASLIGQSQAQTDRLYDYEVSPVSTANVSNGTSSVKPGIGHTAGRARPTPLVDPSTITAEQINTLKQLSIARAGCASSRSQLDLSPTSSTCLTTTFENGHQYSPQSNEMTGGGCEVLLKTVGTLSSPSPPSPSSLISRSVSNQSIGLSNACSPGRLISGSVDYLPGNGFNSPVNSSLTRSPYDRSLQPQPVPGGNIIIGSNIGNTDNNSNSSGFINCNSGNIHINSSSNSHNDDQEDQENGNNHCGTSPTTGNDQSSDALSTATSTTATHLRQPPQLPDQYYHLSAYQRHLYHQLPPVQQQQFANLSLQQQQQLLSAVAVRLQQQKLTPQQLVQQRLKQQQQLQYLQQKKRERDLQLLLQQKQKQQQQLLVQQQHQQHQHQQQQRQQQVHPNIFQTHPITSAVVSSTSPASTIDSQNVINASSNQLSSKDPNQQQTHALQDSQSLHLQPSSPIAPQINTIVNSFISSPDSGLDQSPGSSILSTTQKPVIDFDNSQNSSSLLVMSPQSTPITATSSSSSSSLLTTPTNNRSADDQFEHILRSHVDSLDPNGHIERQVKIGEGSTGLVVGALVTPLFQQWLQQRHHRQQTLQQQQQQQQLNDRFGSFPRHATMLSPPVVAVKRMHVQRQQRKELLLNELLVMRHFQHANIVRLFSSYLVRHELWLVMELMTGGVLTDIVTRARMNEIQIATVSIQCLNALAFLHTHHIVHRDIKSDSILLSVEGRVSRVGTCVL